MATQRRIPAYFSHSYRPEDRPVNDFFWKLFWKQGFSFTVDPKSEALSIPYLELMMKRSACFVAVATRRYEQQLYKCSPFIVHEYGLAVQAHKPRLTFVENEVAGSFFSSDEHVCFFNRQRLADNREDFSKRIEKLAERSRPNLAAIDRPLGKVGLFLPDGESSYRDSLDAIEKALKRHGFSPEEVKCDFGNPFEFAKYLDDFDFVITDVSTPSLPPWIYPFMQGWFVPTVKLVQRGLANPVDPQRLPMIVASEVLTEVAASDELVLYWETPDELLRKLERELSKLGRDRRQLQSYQEGHRYIRSLGRTIVPVFISNANDANEFASHLTRALSLENMLYFHYRFRNTIELGDDWPEALSHKVNASAIFVPLITNGYWESKWCVKEYELANEREKSGDLRIVPYFLEEAGTHVVKQGKPLAGLPRPQQIREIVDDLDKLMTNKQVAGAPRIERIEVIEARHTYTLDTAVDVAIITILPEEYKAVLRHLEDHGRVVASDHHPNMHSWEMGEIRSPNYESPYRVVLALAPHAGTNAGTVATTNTIEAFNPAYVLLVGIAGGLGSLQQGDVVVSDRIWGYEYGKVEGGFSPRPDWNYPADATIVAAANTLAALEPNWSAMISERPPEPREPRIVVGTVGSGDKVVDDVSDRFFRPVLKLWPKLVAIEMEGVGAASAIQNAREMGRRVGFAMIRGISDRPRGQSPGSAARAKGPGLQTQQRDAWKDYAAEAAAVAAVQLIRLCWPQRPSGRGGGAGLAVQAGAD